MRIRRFFCLLLCLVLLAGLLSGCGSDESESPQSSSGDGDTGETAPEDESLRAVWYGFAQDRPADDPVSEKDMARLLRGMLELYDPALVSTWDDMTAPATDEAIYRDYGAIMLLYAAELMDCAVFTYGTQADPLGLVEGDPFNQPIRGGYTLFEIYGINWEDTCPSFAEMGHECNYLNSCEAFVISRFSLVSGKPLMEPEGTDMGFDRALEYGDAALAVLRLYESCSGPAAAIMETEETVSYARQLLAQAGQRREEILNSETRVEYTGTAYYVSNEGDDGNDGLSPETPWQSIERVNNAALLPGDAVFFRRGDTWRAVPVYTQTGVTYSAYGQGDKPRIISSPENGSGADKWQLWWEGENGEKIWVYYRDMPDCGALVLNGEDYARKILGFWNGSEYLNFPGDAVSGGVDDSISDEELLGQEPFVVEKQLAEDMTFFNRADSKLPDSLPVYLFGWNAEGGLADSSGPLYFRCDKGNPGELYEEIEFLTHVGLFDDPASGVVLDNLFIGYGDAVIVNSGLDVTVQNCEIAWVGGMVASYALETDTASNRGIQRLADTLTSCSSNTSFINNYIHEMHHGGVGVEIFTEQKAGTEMNCENITVSGNLLYHCGSGALYFNWDEEPNPNHMFRNVVFEDNYILFTGMNGWLDNGDAPAFADVGGPNMQEGCAVRDNVFFMARTPLIQIDTYASEYLLDFEGNRYLQHASVPVVISASGDVTGRFSDREEVLNILEDSAGSVTQLYSEGWDNLDW